MLLLLLQPLIFLKLTNRSKSLAGAIAISLAAIMWGFDGIVLTPKLYNLKVVFVVFILHVIPFLMMNLFFYRDYRYFKSFTRKDFILIFLVALLGGAIGTMAIVKALFLVNFQKLTVVVLLQKLQPIFAIALATILLKEKIRKGYLIWATTAVLSGYFLTFGFSFPNLYLNQNIIFASLFALLAAFSFGSSTVLSKMVLSHYPFHTATFFRYGFTSLITFVFVLVSGVYTDFSRITTVNWLIILIIVFTTGSGAIFLYYYGLTRVKAMVATICELLFPLSAILFDFWFNKSVLSPVQWISAAILLFSVIRLNTSKS